MHTLMKTTGACPFLATTGYPSPSGGPNGPCSASKAANGHRSPARRPAPLGGVVVAALIGLIATQL